VTRFLSRMDTAIIQLGQLLLGVSHFPFQAFDAVREFRVIRAFAVHPLSADALAAHRAGNDP
jgi:hypothetical protein